MISVTNSQSIIARVKRLLYKASLTSHDGQIPPGDQILTEKEYKLATEIAWTFFKPREVVESNLAPVAVLVAYSRLM